MIDLQKHESSQTQVLIYKSRQKKKLQTNWDQFSYLSNPFRKHRREERVRARRAKRYESVTKLDPAQKRFPRYPRRRLPFSPRELRGTPRRDTRTSTWLRRLRKPDPPGNSLLGTHPEPKHRCIRHRLISPGDHPQLLRSRSSRIAIRVRGCWSTRTTASRGIDWFLQSINRIWGERRELSPIHVWTICNPNLRRFGDFLGVCV